MARSLKLLLIAILLAGAAVFLWNYTTLQQQARDVRTTDSRNAGIEVFTHYGYFVNPKVLVFDLRGLSGDNSPMDVTRTLLQFAERQKHRRFDRVILAYKGTAKFELKGDYFHTLGNDYEHQNPVYTLRTLPENVYRLDGAPAFGTWTGGLLGVVGKQMEDLNELHKQWYLAEYATGG
ncbi:MULTISPECIES: hypothetical protein [Stenotrophomonas]|uniref:hypothetical protein n=1 Tax=Stenotrophomonas TaxID=40323 RepID=UPI0018D2951E|nr:hypothetical protein [Stenotrophomonas sp.]MBH1507617.1 hypothetical protein [Stenotrophomonas maltophilia]